MSEPRSLPLQQDLRDQRAAAMILYACFSRLLRGDPERAPGIREVVRRLLAAGAEVPDRIGEDGPAGDALIAELGIGPPA